MLLFKAFLQPSSFHVLTQISQFLINSASATLLVNVLSTIIPYLPWFLCPHSALCSACAASLLFFLLLLSDSVMSLCDLMDCNTPGFPVLHYSLSLLKLMSIELVMLSNHLIHCHPLVLLPSIFPSIRVFFQ